MLGNNNRLIAAESKFARRSSISIMQSEASESTKYLFENSVEQLCSQEQLDIDEECETSITEISNCCTTLLNNGAGTTHRLILLAANYTVWAFDATSLEIHLQLT